jgi:hypothetical protein
MSVSCECCVLSGRGLCEGLVTRPEESYRVWCVWVWCVWVWSWSLEKWGGLGPQGAVQPLEKQLPTPSLTPSAVVTEAGSLPRSLETGVPQVEQWGRSNYLILKMSSSKNFGQTIKISHIRVKIHCEFASRNIKSIVNRTYRQVWCTANTLVWVKNDCHTNYRLQDYQVLNKH